MKKVLLFAILLATINSACKKSATTAPISSGPTLWIPNNLDSLLPTFATYGAFPYLSNVNGVFTSCRATGALIDTSGVPYDYHRSWQNAILTDSVNSVEVNGHLLSPDLNRVGGNIKAYLNNYNDGTWWTAADTNNWSVDGITAPTFSVNIDGIMPEFTGTFPASITTSSDFTYSFNASNSSAADSAYVLIYTGGHYVHSACVNAHGGVAKITASQFAFSSYTTAPGALTYIDGRNFGGRLMAVVLYSHTFRTIDGKRYAFVKQRIVITTVKLI